MPECASRYVPPHRRTKSKAVRQDIPAARRLYNTTWERRSRSFLNYRPFCLYCQWMDLVSPSEQTDHIRRHLGDMTLFWNADNWQPLCERCHVAKSSSERRGFGIDWPIVDGIFVVSGATPCTLEAAVTRFRSGNVRVETCDAEADGWELARSLRAMWIHLVLPAAVHHHRSNNRQPPPKSRAMPVPDGT